MNTQQNAPRVLAHVLRCALEDVRRRHEPLYSNGLKVIEAVADALEEMADRPKPAPQPKPRPDDAEDDEGR